MSTTDRTLGAPLKVDPPTPQLPLYRLHLMRLGYAFMGIGLAIVKWPVILNHDASWTLHQSIIDSLLTAMSLLALLGLRYPVKMLPVLLFESTWKLLWLTVVALPALWAGDMSPAMEKVFVNCLLGVVILAVTPWGYVKRQFCTAKGDRWR